MPSSEAPSRRFQPVRKLGLLALLTLLLGLPIISLFDFALLLIAGVLIVAGRVSSVPRRWFVAVALVGTALLVQFVLATPRIEEGHNAFLPGGPDNALVSGLPPDVYRLMAADFDALYPPPQRCDPKATGCWRGQGRPDRTYAFSSDSLLHPAAMSRRVTGISFSDPVWLRLGFINDARYNWFHGNSDVQRAKRDGRFWMGWRRWQVTMPYFVAYRFPAEFIGSDLCWRGDVIWEEGAGRFTRLQHTSSACRTLTQNDVGRTIYGLAIKPNSLSMSLDPPITVRVQQFASSAITIIAAIALVGMLVTWKRRARRLAFLIVGLSLAVIAVDDVSFIGGLRPFDGGDDGLVYDTFARNIANALVTGDIRLALQGGEDVFFYGGPGLRYLLAINHILFGETYLGYLLLILALPFIVLALFRRFLPRLWALFLALSFVALPFGVLFGSSFVQYQSLAARGFADPAAAFFLIAGTLFLVGRSAASTPGFWPSMTAGLLFAAAVWVRPNLAPFAGVALGVSGVLALSHARWPRLFGLTLGFLPVFGMVLHNWYFGNAFVLFSSNAGLSNLLVMPPSAYVSAFAELLRFDLSGENLQRAAMQIAQALRGPSGLYLMIPLHAVAVAIVIRVMMRQRFDPWLRIVAAATLTQHAVVLFYAATPRYHFVTWLMTFLITAVWFRMEALPYLQKRYAWHREHSGSPMSASVKTFLRRL